MLTISEAKLEDMDFILSLAKAEGWNPGLNDAFPFYYTDPHGFFLGQIGDKKIGCISAVAYNDTFGFIGFYIVLPEYRTKGFGHQLWDYASRYLGNRTIGLDGVLKQQKVYEQHDFKLYYKNQRFVRKNTKGHYSKTLVNLKTIILDDLLKYDTPIFGIERARFLQAWTAMPETFALGKLINNQLVGYGVLRPCQEGFKIGPLFANTLDIGLELFDSLCAKAENRSVYIDIPQANPSALKIAENFNLSSVFETVRMYNKQPPNQNIEKVFGVTSFELG